MGAARWSSTFLQIDQVTSHRSTTFLLGVILLTGAPSIGCALEGVDLSIGNLEGAGWALEGVETHLDWRGHDSAMLRLSVAKVVLPEITGNFSGLHAECYPVSFTPEAISCHGGVLSLDSALGVPQRCSIDFDYRPSTGRLVIALDGLRVDGGSLAARLERDSARWSLFVRGEGLQLAALSRRLVSPGVLSGPLTGEGTLAFTARLQGSGAQVDAGTLSAQLQTGKISDASGRLAAEDLRLQLRAGLDRNHSSWQITTGVDAGRGQVYVEPLFLDLDSHPLRVTSTLNWKSDDGGLEVQALDYDQRDTVRLHATGVLTPNQSEVIDHVSLALDEGHLPELYETYLQPWLSDSPLSDLATSGAVTGDIQWRQGELAGLRLVLDDVAFQDREGRYGLDGLRARLNWAKQGATPESVLHWRSGHLYRVPLTTGELVLEAAGSHMRLRKPAQIGVVDGNLQIDTLAVDHSSTGAWRWNGDAILTPVSLPTLCRSLGWPEFAGKLSGVIPDLGYANGALRVGGTLLVRVFDGAVTLDNLELQNPLSTVPELRVDARVNNIDLEPLTRAFSFGKIEGRLDGRIAGLEMEAWSPVAFDARFATPADDTSRHRISQKAVDNLSSIGGGGVGGALSSGMLRFFEDFPYDRLGISCRLRNGICEMGGVAPAENGYYIVKGRFLPPRLNIIGYADRVNWRQLVSQVTAVIRH
jgi:hypothetical protein